MASATGAVVGNCAKRSAAASRGRVGERPHVHKRWHRRERCKRLFLLQVLDGRLEDARRRRLAAVRLELRRHVVKRTVRVGRRLRRVRERQEVLERLGC
jgi:hypothetical protein